jgi:hypothetical protein
MNASMSAGPIAMMAETLVVIVIALPGISRIKSARTFLAIARGFPVWIAVAPSGQAQ